MSQHSHNSLIIPYYYIRNCHKIILTRHRSIVFELTASYIEKIWLIASLNILKTILSYKRNKWNLWIVIGTGIWKVNKMFIVDEVFTLSLIVKVSDGNLWSLSIRIYNECGNVGWWPRCTVAILSRLDEHRGYIPADMRPHGWTFTARRMLC